MLRRSNYDLVDEDGYDMRIPAVSEEAFQYGILFKLKYVGSLDIPRPSSRTDIISAMRRIRCEYKLRSTKKKKVVMIVSVDGIKTFSRKPKSYSSKRLFHPFLKRDHSTSSVTSTPALSSKNGPDGQRLTRANSATPISSAVAAKVGPVNLRSCTAEPIGGADDKANDDAKLNSTMSLNTADKEGLPESEPPLFHHPIHRIFFVSHYSPDERVFSYIARNASTSTSATAATTGNSSGVIACPFTCYVFKCYKKSEAIRIVRTIGQSFEVCHNLSQKLLQKQQQKQTATTTPGKSDIKQDFKAQQNSSNSEVINSAITAALNYSNSVKKSSNSSSNLIIQPPAKMLSSTGPPTSLYSTLTTNISSGHEPEALVYIDGSDGSLAGMPSSIPEQQLTQAIALQEQRASKNLSQSMTSSSISAASTLTTMSPCQMNETYNLNNYYFDRPDGLNLSQFLNNNGNGDGAAARGSSNHSTEGTFTNDEEEPPTVRNSANDKASSSHLFITNNASQNSPSPLMTSIRSSTTQQQIVGGFLSNSLSTSSSIGNMGSSDARAAVFQRMLELQRQENDAALAEAERLRQQLMAECDARQAAQQRNSQLLRQNCELVDKLTQLFERLERVERSLINSQSVQQISNTAPNIMPTSISTRNLPSSIAPSPREEIAAAASQLPKLTPPPSLCSRKDLSSSSISWQYRSLKEVEPAKSPLDKNLDAEISKLIHAESSTTQQLPPKAPVSKNNSSSDTTGGKQSPPQKASSPEGDRADLGHDNLGQTIEMLDEEAEDGARNSTFSNADMLKHQFFSCSL